MFRFRFVCRGGILRRLALVFILAVFSMPVYGTDYYVSVKGKDSNAGTQSKPFATLERARDAAERAKRAGR